MKEYISKDYLNSILNAKMEDSRGAEHFAYDQIVQELNHAPTSEIVHFKSGYWIVGLDGSYACSECKKVFRYEIGNYCSNCGAIMCGIQ